MRRKGVRENDPNPSGSWVGSAAKLLFNKNLTISTAATTTRNAAEVPTYKHLYNALEIFCVQTDGWE
jgi:hypothetical protein